MILILDGAEAVGYLRHLATDGAHEVREQPHGRCRYFDDKGSLTLDGDGPSPREDRPPCTYDGECPHLNNPNIGCPITESLSSMRKSPPPQAGAVPPSDYVLAPQEPVPDLESAPLTIPKPQGVPRAKKNEWDQNEESALMGATSPIDAVRMYRAVYPDSDRSDAAIKTRYHIRIKKSQPVAEDTDQMSEALPDFAGDQVPITQCEESPEGDVMAAEHAIHSNWDEDPGHRSAGKPHAWIGIRVKILDPMSGLHGCTGLVLDYNYSCRKLLVDLDGSGLLWIAPESLLLIGAGGAS